MTPFSLRIFLPDGDPDGLRIVDRTNWNGKALVFPRAAWAQPSLATRPDLAQTGVYLLLGPRENGEGDRRYIGEGDPVKPRLPTHHSGNAQKDFWTRAICFVSMGQGLNKAPVQFLEANLIRLGVLAQKGSDYVFTQDYSFSSPSTAASVVLGRSANGRLEWKDAQGRTLIVLQAGGSA